VSGAVGAACRAPAMPQCPAHLDHHEVGLARVLHRELFLVGVGEELLAHLRGIAGRVAGSEQGGSGSARTRADDAAVPAGPAHGEEAKARLPGVHGHREGLVHRLHHDARTDPVVVDVQDCGTGAMQERAGTQVTQGSANALGKGAADRRGPHPRGRGSIRAQRPAQVSGTLPAAGGARRLHRWVGLQPLRYGPHPGQSARRHAARGRAHRQGRSPTRRCVFPGLRSRSRPA